MHRKYGEEHGRWSRYHSYKGKNIPTVAEPEQLSANQPSVHANIRNDYYGGTLNMTQMRLWGMQRAFRGVLEGGIQADELGHLVDAAT